MMRAFFHDYTFVYSILLQEVHFVTQVCLPEQTTTQTTVESHTAIFKILKFVDRKVYTINILG